MENNLSSEEKTFRGISSLGAIFGFILPLIMWLLKKNEFSDYTKNFLADMLNFEIIIFIISIALWMVPFMRWILSMVLFVFNLVIALRCFSASQEGKEYDMPIKVQLLK